MYLQVFISNTYKWKDTRKDLHASFSAQSCLLLRRASLQAWLINVARLPHCMGEVAGQVEASCDLRGICLITRIPIKPSGSLGTENRFHVHVCADFTSNKLEKHCQDEIPNASNR